MDLPLNPLKPVIGPSTFGLVLKHGLKLRKLRQNEFAKKVGVSAVQVTHWVNKTHVPQEETLAKVWLGLDGYMVVPHPDANPQNNFNIYFGYKTETLDSNLVSLYHENYNQFMEAYNNARNACDFSFPKLLTVTETTSESFSDMSSSSSGRQLHREELLQRLIVEYSILEEELGSLERLGLTSKVDAHYEKLRFVQDSRSRLMDMLNVEKYRMTDR